MGVLIEEPNRGRATTQSTADMARSLWLNQESAASHVYMSRPMGVNESMYPAKSRPRTRLLSRDTKASTVRLLDRPFNPCSESAYASYSGRSLVLTNGHIRRHQDAAARSIEEN